jgi:hypothetical protein
LRLTFSGTEIISVLNLHATAMADERKTSSIEFYDLFNKFIQSWSRILTKPFSPLTGVS